MTSNPGNPDSDGRVTATTTARWFYKTDGVDSDSGASDTGKKDASKSGPVDTETLRGLLAERCIAPDTKVWREGFAVWMAASEVEEFADAVAAGRAVSLRSTSGGAALSRRNATLLLGSLAVISLFVAQVSAFLRRSSGAQITGVVMTNGQPVSGGNVVFAPLAESKDDLPGKPAVADVADDGRYSLSLTRGNRGLARRFRVRFSPPVLPPMDEQEAMKAVPPYAGLVPKESEVEISPGGKRVDIELVPAGSR